MMITVYRPPYRDEYWYGWVTELAEQNIGSGFERMFLYLFLEIFFPFASIRNADGKFSPKLLRADYVTGIADNLEYLRLSGFSVPDVDTFIRYHTCFSVLGIAKTFGHQAEAVETMIRSKNYDKWDLPRLKCRVHELRYCPVCSENDRKDRDPYFRTWHQIPGIKVCAEHGVQLLKILPKYAVNVIKSKDEGAVPCVKEATAEDRKMAVYVKQIYENPVFADAGIINRVLGADGNKKIGKESISFEQTVKCMMRVTGSYTEILRRADPWIRLNEEQVLSELPEHVEIRWKLSHVSCFRCMICGKVWHAHPHAVLMGFWCPECDRKLADEVRYNRLLNHIGDGNYELAEPFKGIGCCHKNLHRTCGTVIGVKANDPYIQIWGSSRCRCETCLDISQIQEKVDRISSGFLVIHYDRRCGKIWLKHSCGGIYETAIGTFQNRPKCRICETGKTKILPQDQKETKITVQKKTRKNKTDRLALFMEVKEHLKTHKVWSAKENYKKEKNRRYIRQLEKLGKMEGIYHVSYGFYSDREDVTVYDILEERFLRDENGKLCGTYTGETALYLEGKSAAEPEELSLESSRVSKRAYYRITVCGKTVLIKGMGLRR